MTARCPFCEAVHPLPAEPQQLSRLLRLPLVFLPPVQENLDPPGLFLPSELLLERVEEVKSVSGHDEQEGHFLPRLLDD